MVRPSRSVRRGEKAGPQYRVSFSFTPDRTLAENFHRVRERNLRRIFDDIDYQANYIQQKMRANAPWTDRTGRARAGLYAVAMRQGEKFTVRVGFDDTVVNPRDEATYGGILESQKEWAIIGPTTQNFRDLLEVISEDFISSRNPIVRKKVKN